MSRRTALFTLLGMAALAPLMIGGCKGVADPQAEKRFRAEVGNTSITVFPTYVRDGEQHRYDAESARTLAAFLSETGIATAHVSTAEVPLTTEWGMNQARMFAHSATDFSRHVKTNEIDTNHAMLAEYLIGGRSVPVGVHVYVVERGGAIAYGTLSNSHHAAFTAVDPQTIEDCTEVAKRTLSNGLDEHVKQNAAKTGQAEFGYASTLMVLPVKMPGGPADKVGQALAGLLENGGMPNLQPSTLTFEPAAETQWEQVPELLSEFIRKNALPTDYALYAEILGTHNPPKVEEVRSVLVGRDGKLVWVDRQGRDDSDFRRINPRNPMTCCVLAATRVLEHFGIDESTAPPEGEGTIAQLWEKDSGLPAREERAAIGLRQELLRNKEGAVVLTVYPVQLFEETDVDSAAGLVDLLNGTDGLSATISDEAHRPVFEIEGNSNEMRRLWDLAKAFRAFVRQNPPASAYALCAEYAIRPNDQKVWSVHTIVCDRAGEWVIVDLQNEYQADFKRIDPQDKADCNRLVVERIKRYAR